MRIPIVHCSITTKWAWRPSAVLVATLLAVAPSPTQASHDPARSATVFVPGFDPQGGARVGVFGADETDAVLDQAATLVHLPTSSQAGGLSQPNVVTMTRYYGDTPPPYYDAADLAALDSVTDAWGGGVPRHALIVAKYARHVLERSGADQINFLSGSFGSLIVRWLIEKDVEHLASEGRIARWLSIEGVVAGNWAASQDDLVHLIAPFETIPIDVDHMNYDWIETNLHRPRRQADSPLYAGILMGQIGSTDDRLNERALTAAMLSRGVYQPNDGVQGLWDARFDDVTSRARFIGRGPTFSLFHETHYSIRDNLAAWIQAFAFLTQRRRVTVTLRRSTVNDVHEPAGPFLDLRPGEVVFQSRVHSPLAAQRWGITGAMSALELEGAAPPLYRFERNGSTLEVDQVLFDDFILDGETGLDLELWAEEVDLELRYGVSETFVTPYFQDLGGDRLTVSTQQPNTYFIAASSWSGEIEVAVFDYPFATPTASAPDIAFAPEAGLRLWPNPFRDELRIMVPPGPSAAPNTTLVGDATLRIFDARGYLVRALVAPAASAIVWDGRDGNGNDLPAGMYFYEIATPMARFTGRSLRVR